MGRLKSDRKRTQRARLLNGMIALAAQEGYAHTTIAKVISHARVSRPTFYEYFADKDACFVAAMHSAQEQLLAQLEEALDSETPERAPAVAARVLVEFVGAHRTAAQLLMRESLVGSPRVTDARELCITQIADIVERRGAQAEGDALSPDISTLALIGAIQRLLASRLRRAQHPSRVVLEELLAWIDSYAAPIRNHRWRALTPTSTPALSPFLPAAPLRAPPPLAPGRPRLSTIDVAENHRQRILFSTAELVDRDGYAAASVAEITRLARVDARAFSRLFNGKRDAFAAMQALIFQRLMAITVGAFFSGSDWSQRIWEAGRAFTQFVEQNPVLIRASLSQSHTPGGATVDRSPGLISAFTIFLQEGYQSSSSAPSPSQLALSAIAATNLEIVHRQARDGRRPAISGLLGHLSHVCMAPFLGSIRANELIDRQLTAESPAGKRDQPRAIRST